MELGSPKVCAPHVLHTLVDEKCGWWILFTYKCFFFFLFSGLSRFIPSSIAAKPMLSARTRPASPSPTTGPRSLLEEVRYALRQGCRI